MVEEGFYFQRLAAAYVRGRLAATGSPPLDELSREALEQQIAGGLAAGLRLHRFKRTMGLPRVQRVLGMLRGLQPENLLDVGSGRGAALWPLADAFPELPLTALDRLAHRVADMAAVRAGGVDRLHAVAGDATRLPFRAGSFDGVTMLEVLEHLPEPAAALAEAIRVARRFILLSVPSRPDNNPEHLRLFSRREMEGLLAAAGAVRIKSDAVLNHLIVLAQRE
jgi:SAM-dependent methyltransferase